MSGSETQSKTSQSRPVQLPLKGFYMTWQRGEKQREITLEGMGGNRVRLHFKKGHPDAK